MLILLRCSYVVLFSNINLDMYYHYVVMSLSIGSIITIIKRLDN